jgi:hypothetical protein
VKQHVLSSQSIVKVAIRDDSTLAHLVLLARSAACEAMKRDELLQAPSLLLP